MGAWVGRIFGTAVLPVGVEPCIGAHRCLMRTLGKAVHEDVVHGGTVICTRRLKVRIVGEEQKAPGRTLGKRKIHIVDACRVIGFVIPVKPELVVKQSAVAVLAHFAKVEREPETIVFAVETAVFGEDFAVIAAVRRDCHARRDQGKVARNFQCDFKSVFCRKCASVRTVFAVEGFNDLNLHEKPLFSALPCRRSGLWHGSGWI